MVESLLSTIAAPFLQQSPPCSGHRSNANDSTAAKAQAIGVISPGGDCNGGLHPRKPVVVYGFGAKRASDAADKPGFRSGLRMLGLYHGNRGPGIGAVGEAASRRPSEVSPIPVGSRRSDRHAEAGPGCSATAATDPAWGRRTNVPRLARNEVRWFQWPSPFIHASAGPWAIGTN